MRVNHNDDSLTAGDRGPTPLEVLHAREKTTRFDHERISGAGRARARRGGAYGYFQPDGSWLSDRTAAKSLTDPQEWTPVFGRFSAVAGSRGSADTVRDVRGSATQFHTSEGNYDLVGNNFPLFSIQDGTRFPGFVQAVGPEPDNEIPQARAAHGTLWDFASPHPETLQAITGLMSDRALPRSYRRMWSSYSENTPAGGCPVVNGASEGVFSHHQEEGGGAKVRRRSQSF